MVQKLARALLLALLHAFYRIRVRGLENLPRGGALLCVNHLSHGDALFVGAATPRRVYFLMHRSFFRAPVVGWVAKLFDTIPVASEDSAAEKQESLRRAAELARAGQLVCIFPEGAISRTGHLLGFKRGLETIARDAGVPIVPVVLDRVWGSIFSFSSGRVFWKLPQRLPYPIDVIVGAPLAPESEAWRVRDALSAELAQARVRRAAESRPLSYRFVRSARRHASRVALVDAGGARVTYAELLRSALELAAVLRRECPAEEVVVALPAGAEAALLHVALVLAGKTAVPEDPRLPCGTPGCIDAPRLAELRGRVTAEDRREATRFADPQPAAARPVLRLGGGLVLTHACIAANVQSLSQVFALAPEDRVLGLLPFSDALGHGATIWLPLLSGACAIYHPDPLDTPGLEALCRSERPTLLVGRPDSCDSLRQRIAAPALASLRLAVCAGAEPSAGLARAWEERFGGALLEGFTAPELGLLAAVNVPDFVRGSARQQNHRPGSAGRALPGVALRVVDPASGALLPPGARGLLLVSGPIVPGEGWHSTGAFAELDKDGFLTLAAQR